MLGYCMSRSCGGGRAAATTSDGAVLGTVTGVLSPGGAATASTVSALLAAFGAVRIWPSSHPAQYDCNWQVTGVPLVFRHARLDTDCDMPPCAACAAGAHVLQVHGGEAGQQGQGKAREGAAAHGRALHVPVTHPRTSNECRSASSCHQRFLRGAPDSAR